MNIRRIGPELDRELLSRSLAGESTRDLAQWLSEDKGITGCSHMTVARRLVGLKFAESLPSNVTAMELDRAINGMLAAFRNIDEEFEELSEIARLPPDDPRRGDLTALRLMTTRRQQSALTQFRYLTERLRTMRREHIRHEPQAESPHAPEPIRHLKQLRTILNDRSQTPPQQTAPAPMVAAPQPEPERNKPCPCGSGMKYKRCCGGGDPRSVTPTVTDGAANPRRTAA